MTTTLPALLLLGWLGTAVALCALIAIVTAGRELFSPRP